MFWTPLDMCTDDELPQSQAGVARGYEPVAQHLEADFG
jgi:hypothetical protein